MFFSSFLFYFIIYTKYFTHPIADDATSFELFMDFSEIDYFGLEIKFKPVPGKYWFNTKFFFGEVKHNTYESSGIISPNIGYFSIGKRGLLFQFRGGNQFYTNTAYLDEGSSFLDYITFDICLGANF